MATTSVQSASSFTSHAPLLANPITSFEYLADIIFNIGKVKVTALRDAIDQFSEYVQVHMDDAKFDFYKDLLPKIQEWALDAKFLGKPIQLLSKHVSATVELEEEFVRHILSNAFFGNINLKGDKAYGMLNFCSLYRISDGVGMARMLCFLCYFYVINKTPLSNHKVTFQRISLNDPAPPSSSYSQPIPPDWRNSATLVNTELIHIHDGRMEAPQATAFVDFANRDLHIHQVIASATQEEVLFSCCPEAFPGILFCERMLDDEVIIIKGCRRFCDYDGYLFTFDFKKAFLPPLPAQDIIAIDAVYASHFKEPQNIRDLNKAFLGFLQCTGERNTISTGYWGCGAFGGDKIHKFIQQVCVSTLTNTVLHFSSFSDNAMCEKLRNILKQIRDAQATVSDLVLITLAFQRQSSFATFFDTEITKLKESRNNPQ